MSNEKKTPFEINNKIEISRADKDDFYKSIIMDISKDYLMIGLPMKEGTSLFLENNADIHCRILNPDAIYSFDTKMAERVKSDQIPMYKLIKPKKVMRKQRRNFFRFPATIDIEYRVYDEDLVKKEQGKAKTGRVGASKQSSKEENPFKKTVTLDVGGGGLKFVATEQLKYGDKLDLRLYLSSKKVKDVVDVKGIIRRVSKVPEDKRNHHIAVEYMQISEGLRDKIVQYIFVLMREKTI